MSIRNSNWDQYLLNENNNKFDKPFLHELIFLPSMNMNVVPGCGSPILWTHMKAATFKLFKP